MTEKRFERIYADVDVFCRDHNAKGVSQLIEREDYDRTVDLLNELNDEKEHYKSIFFELVETALTDKNCRELYCKGILDIFNKANSLNQAREMIKEHLE